MEIVDKGTGALIADWQIGDRAWTQFHGTGTVMRLRKRASTGLKQDALVKFTVPATHQHWTILVNLHRLAPGEPDRLLDRLPDGLLDAETCTNCGDFVHHLKFGNGVVVELQLVDGLR